MKLTIALHRAHASAEATAIFWKHPGCPTGPLQRTACLRLVAFQDKKYQEAIQLIERALKSDSSAYTAFSNLGLAYRAAGNVEQHPDAATSGRSNSETTSMSAAATTLPRGLFRREPTMPQRRRRVPGGMVEQRPDYAEAHHDLGCHTARGQGRDGSSLELSTRPCVEAGVCRGALPSGNDIGGAGQNGRCMAAYQHGLMLNPNIAGLAVALGSIMLPGWGFLEDALRVLFD